MCEDLYGDGCMDNQRNEENKEETNKNFEFLKEIRKDRPINKKRLLFKIIFTAGLAVIFGVVSCITFFALKPHVDPWLNPVELEPVTIPQDQKEEDEPDQEPEPVAEPEPEQIIVEKVELELEDYVKLYDKLHQVVQKADSFLTTVTGLTEEVDWFQNTYPIQNQTTGVIVADNGKELLILANQRVLENAQTILVEFCNGKEVEGIIKGYDGNTDLAIIGVNLDEIGEETMNVLVKAQLGNSYSSSLDGLPTIAIGTFQGISKSSAYGMITSIHNQVRLADTDLHLLSTDINGGKDASGVLINYQGEVLGIIDSHFNGEDNNSLVSALSISDLKGTIEKLSNGQGIAYLGIYGTDVPDEVHKEQGVPKGAYVTDVHMDSPAMNEGIQSGDVIIKIGTTNITSFTDYKSNMSKRQPGDIAMITVMRRGRNGYTELNYEIMLSRLE